MEDISKNVDNYFIKTFMSMIKASVKGIDVSELSMRQEEMELYYKLANRNRLVPVLFPLVKAYYKKILDGYSDDILKSWSKETIITTIPELKKYKAMQNLINEADKEGIKLVFFKGAVLADLYSSYLLRTSGDTDIFIYEKDRYKAIKLLEQLGYVKNEEHSKETVPVYFNKDLFHVVELHFCLWEDYKGPKMKLMEEFHLTAEEKLIQITVCEMTFFTLGYEEHLIYQIFHIVKHFSLEAVELRYLMDITLYINRYANKINLSSFWNKMKLLGYEKFCYALFDICVSYLGMEDKILKVAGEIEKTDKDKLLNDILSIGEEEHGDVALWQIFGLITPYLEGKEQLPKNKWKRIIKLLFPPPAALPEKCSYAKKYTFLLPIAWAHKFIGWLIRYIMHYKNGKNATEGNLYGPNAKLKASEYRLSLMNKYGLIKNKN